MSEYYISPKSAFDATADSIRAKTGSQASITWDGTNGFADAVAAIPAGFSVSEMADGSKPSGEINISGVALVPYAFANRPNITRVTVNCLAAASGYWFAGCTGIQSAYVHMPSGTAASIFSNCTGLVSAVYRSDSGIGGAMIFNNCSNLETADIDNAKIMPMYFYGCNKLTAVILRKSSEITGLDNVSAFTYCNTFKSGGSGGTIYIPKALYDHLGDGTSLDYKAATNWSTIDGYGTITWAKIEGSQYENYYADGTPISA